MPDNNSNFMTRANTGGGNPVLPPTVVEPTASIKAPSGVPYSNPAGTEYPVIAYNNYKFKEGATETQIRKMLQTIKDCGFNASIWVCRGLDGTWVNQIKTYYNVSKDMGLRTIQNLVNSVPRVNQSESNSVQSYGLEYNPKLEDNATFLNKNKNDGNLWGYDLGDEPTPIEWHYDSLTAPLGARDFPAMYRTYLRNANRHVGFFNLVAATTAGWIGQTLANDTSLNEKGKYSRYLKAFKEKFNPSMMSVDIYPVFEETTDSDHSYDLGGYYLLKRYYYIMEAIGNFSTEHKMPFWMFMLSTQFNSLEADGETIRSKHPCPSEGVLRYQAMTALAYGFQGLVFWTYALKESSDNEEYITAPYQEGENNEWETTPVWTNCKAVIPEIKSYGKELLDARFQEARHVYGPLCKIEFEETEKLTSSIGCISGATANGRGFVITRLTKNTQNYVAIVSHDPINAQGITLSIASGYSPVEVGQTRSVSEDSSEATEPRIASGQTVSRTLRPGGMILIRY